MHLVESGSSGTEREQRPTTGQLIEGGDRHCDHRRDPAVGVGHARTQLDPAGGQRVGGERHEDVLLTGEPLVRMHEVFEPEFLGQSGYRHDLLERFDRGHPNTE